MKYELILYPTECFLKNFQKVLTIHSKSCDKPFKYYTNSFSFSISNLDGNIENRTRQFF